MDINYLRLFYYYWSTTEKKINTTVIVTENSATTLKIQDLFVSGSLSQSSKITRNRKLNRLLRAAANRPAKQAGSQGGRQGACQCGTWQFQYIKLYLDIKLASYEEDIVEIFGQVSITIKIFAFSQLLITRAAQYMTHAINTWWTALTLPTCFDIWYITHVIHFNVLCHRGALLKNNSGFMDIQLFHIIF